MPGSGTETKVRASILRMMLRGLTVIALVGTSALLVRDLTAGAAFSLPLTLLLLDLGACAAALFLTDRVPPSGLRVVELAVFGGVAATLAAHGYASLAAAGGEAAAATAAWHRTILNFVLLLFAYGVLVPGRWGRAAVVSTILAATPLASAGLLQARLPEALEPVAGSGHLLYGGAVLAGSAVLATLSTLITDRFFQAAYDAGDANLYDLEELIGAGGMGEVWRARHRTLARPAAIKLVRRDRLADGHPEAAEKLLRRFEREAMATAKLRSPHTVEVYDFGVTKDGTFFYAMEYLDGLDLDNLVRRFGPQPAERVIHLLSQACYSLADAHGHGLTHRDIKPANLIASRLGVQCDWIKLVDFGLVKLDPAADLGTQLTGDGTTSGTPAYMAPEMALQADAVDWRADLYALGCVGYWLLTGKHVFESDSPMGIIVDHVKTEPVPPSRRTELPVPEKLDRIVLKCLAKDPADRFQSAAQLAEALAAVPVSRPWDQRQACEWWDVHLPSPARSAAA